MVFVFAYINRFNIADFEISDQQLSSHAIWTKAIAEYEQVSKKFYFL